MIHIADLRTSDDNRIRSRRAYSHKYISRVRSFVRLIKCNKHDIHQQQSHVLFLASNHIICAMATTHYRQPPLSMWTQLILHQLVALLDTNSRMCSRASARACVYSKFNSIRKRRNKTKKRKKKIFAESLSRCSRARDTVTWNLHFRWIFLMNVATQFLRIWVCAKRKHFLCCCAHTQRAFGKVFVCCRWQHLTTTLHVKTKDWRHLVSRPHPTEWVTRTL